MRDRPATECEVDEREIKVTPKMILAGMEVVCAYFDEVIAYGSETSKEVARLVYLAMVAARKDIGRVS